jgi:hypothetical protein
MKVWLAASDSDHPWQYDRPSQSDVHATIQDRPVINEKLIIILKKLINPFINFSFTEIHQREQV